MARSPFSVAAFLILPFSVAAQAEQIPVRHIQLPRHEFMVARSETGKVLARVEFTETVQGDDVTMRLTYNFTDGSIDDERTTYSQRGEFRLVRDHHIEKGPYFPRPVDFAVEAASGTATSLTQDKNGKTLVQSQHIELPNDLANGIVGTLLLNVPANTKPFRAGILAPAFGGRLLRILISPQGQQPFHRAGQNLVATVFRIHPELGGFLGMIATLLNLQPKDVTVWILEGEQPAVVRVVGQLGGSGPVLSSELEGTSFTK
jgi:hypothetical protein